MWVFVIILLLLFFLLSPAIKVWRAVRKFQNDYNQAMNQAGHKQRASSQNYDSEKEEIKERYRRYSDETGEYVSFEEVEGRPEPQHTSPEHHTAPNSSTKYQDEIVSDAEFEEI